MPFRIEIHQNSFLEGIYQKGWREGWRKTGQEDELECSRSLLLYRLEVKFGAVSPEARARIDAADLATLDLWCSTFALATTLDEVFL